MTADLDHRSPRHPVRSVPRSGRPQGGRGFRGFVAALGLLLASMSLPAMAQPVGDSLSEDPIGAPLRIRDFTFPSYLVLDFAPQPAAPLGKGRWAAELHYSVINNFQLSSTVEDYLEQERGGVRRPLNAEEAEFILSLPEGKGFYIDGEFDFLDLLFHYGVTDRLDIGIGLSFIDFSGGGLDGTIFDFHDQYGFGQQGRQFTPDGQFQIVIGESGEGLTLIDGPPSGGVSDPSLYLRYALPDLGRWRFSLSGGVKVPVADEGFLSSGGVDVGLSLTADRRWRRNAVIANLSVVEAGEFSGERVDPPLLPSLNLTWMRTVGPSRRTRFSLQGLVAEHAFRDLFDSAISELEVQLTAGLKRATRAGVFGVGLTENLFSFDNTPDIGVHFTWGYLSR